MDSNNNGSFWPSYVDIMTTLFAITLVLFAVSFSRFKIKEKDLKEKVEQLRDDEEKLQFLVNEYENIITVYSTVREIDSTEYFGYNEEYLKHLFTLNVEYQTGEYHINRLKLDRNNPHEAHKRRKEIIEAGKIIKQTIENLERSNSSLNNIKFLVVIEGQASKVRFQESDWMNNYTLSYLRAQYLNEFWKNNGIDIDAIPKCELIISGSGEGGVPRIIPNEDSLHLAYPNSQEYVKHWIDEESKNQRFLIHIVPVIGNIDGTLEKIKELKNEKR